MIIPLGHWERTHDREILLEQTLSQYRAPPNVLGYFKQRCRASKKNETMKITEHTARVCVLIVTALILPQAVLLRAQNYVRDSEPALFSYDELVQLGLRQELSPELAEKLGAITTTPFVNNEAYLE